MEENLSRLINNILRHKLDKYRIPYDEEGYALLADIMRQRKVQSTGASVADVLRIVENSRLEGGKLRFQVKDHQDGKKIRCTEAHSLQWLDLAQAHTKVTLHDLPDALLFHGTTYDKLASMMIWGITTAPGKSGHVRGTYFLDDYYGAAKGKYTYYVVVNAKHALLDGLPLYMTERGKYVSDEVLLPSYFEGTMSQHDFFNMTQEVFNEWNKQVMWKVNALLEYSGNPNRESGASSSSDQRVKREQDEEPWDGDLFG